MENSLSNYDPSLDMTHEATISASLDNLIETYGQPEMTPTRISWCMIRPQGIVEIFAPVDIDPSFRTSWQIGATNAAAFKNFMAELADNITLYRPDLYSTQNIYA